MGRLCCVYGCRGNYRGEPYSQVVSFPKDEKSRNEWFEALPNDRKQLEEKKQLWVCRKHFNCDFIKSQGGERPTGPPTIFEGIPKSCLNRPKNGTNLTMIRKKEKTRFYLLKPLEKSFQRRSIMNLFLKSVMSLK